MCLSDVMSELSDDVLLVMDSFPKPVDMGFQMSVHRGSTLSFLNLFLKDNGRLL